MRSLIFSCPLVLAACGSAPDPDPAPTEQPASAPAGHHAHHHGQHGHVHRHGFEDPEAWSAKWDTAERDAWQKPDAVLAAMAISPTDSIADIGAGTGYFAVRLAAEAPEGVVYAIDLQPQMVQHLGERAAKLGLSNIRPVRATADDAAIPEPVDVVMLTNTYHHIGGRTAYFARVAESLRPGGRVVIVDYRVEFDGPGPPGRSDSATRAK